MVDVKHNLASWLISLGQRRPPDIIIGGAADPYMNRWYLIPRNRFLNIYLHQFIRSDDDHAVHDHPWPSLSWMLAGMLVEVTPRPAGFQHRDVVAGQWVYRGSTFSHRLIVPVGLSGQVWTIFITGPRLRDWGFWCPKGWVQWQDFTGGPNGELVGKGCGEP